MWIFIKGIPKQMDSRALEKFVKRLLYPGWLPFNMTGRTRISGSKILKIVHTRTRSVEYHGLIRIYPASKVESVIERINQSKIDGRTLQSHLYNRRLLRSDRRKGLVVDAQDRPFDRRRLERRRKHLVSQIVDASF